MKFSQIAGALIIATLGLAAARAFAQPQHVDPGIADTFAAKCATCHDPAIGRAPAREELARRDPAAVLQTLTKGSMSAMTADLTPQVVRDLVAYVTGKPLDAATGATAASLSASSQPADPMCPANPAISAKVGDWNGYGKDLGASRHQTISAINPGNVGHLKVKWAFSVAGGRVGQPTVIGDHLFFVTFAGDTYSLDAKSGCVHWRHKLGGPARQSPIVAHRGGKWIVYVGDNNRDFHALDAMTGAELWKLNLDKHPLSMLTGSPAISGDLIYVPVSSSEENTANLPNYSCCTFAGSVNAIDLRTGKLAWRTPMLQPKPTRLNSAGTQLYGPAGAAVWSQPTIDAKRGQLYVATGDSYTEAEAPTSDAVVAIDLRTGKIKWTSQVTTADNFLIGCGPRRGLNCALGDTGPDHDFGASPILATLPGGKQVVVSGQKSAMVYGMDPDSGKLLWKTKAGGGGPLGGIEWGMAADAHAVYAAVSDAATPKDLAKPGLTAINPASGDILWQTPAPQVPCSWTGRCTHAQSAPPTVVPGLVFEGGHDGWLRAYASDTGKPVWTFDSAGQTYATTNGVAAQKGGSFDHTGFVVANGMMYAVSGYNGATGAYGNPLNVLLAFSVDGK